MTRPDPDLPLLRGVADGDADALEALYDRHIGLLYPLALRILRVPADAEEALQQAWLRTWMRAGDHDPVRETVVGWLLAAVRSRALELARSRAARRHAEGLPEPAEGAREPAAGADLSPLQQRVRLALQRLDPHFRQVLEGAFFDGLTQTQLAERLEAPLGTVKTWTRRGLLRLRELLPQELGA